MLQEDGFNNCSSEAGAASTAAATATTTAAAGEEEDDVHPLQQVFRVAAAKVFETYDLDKSGSISRWELFPAIESMLGTILHAAPELPTACYLSSMCPSDPMILQLDARHGLCIRLRLRLWHVLQVRKLDVSHTEIGQYDAKKALHHPSHSFFYPLSRSPLYLWPLWRPSADPHYGVAALVSTSSYTMHSKQVTCRWNHA